MQTDHRVPTNHTVLMRLQQQQQQQQQTQQQYQHRKRSLSNMNARKRDRHDLICVVCHAPAMGYNFDQITCESCKAFFRRNALNNADKFKCRSGTNDCPMTLETRKRCKACRLKKCFDKGLRKEWIMSEEEKRTKKQKIEDNRRLRAMSQNSTIFALTPSSSPPIVPENEHYFSPIVYRKRRSNDDDINDDYNDDDDSDQDQHHHHHQTMIQSFEDTNELPDIKPTADMLNEIIKRKHFDYNKSLLANEYCVLLKTIEENYARAVRLNVSVIRGCHVPCLRNLNDITDVVNEPAQMSSLRLITFLKLTPEFHGLHEDDRLALVKHNLLTVLYLHLCMCVDIETEIYHEPNTTNDFRYHVSELRHYSEEIYRRSMMLVREIHEIVDNDHLIIKLAMLTFIFSKGSDENEPTWLEPQKIFYGQNLYLTLLWKYLDVRFSTDQTASIISRLIFASMKAQNLARLTKTSVTNKSVNNDQLAPLMQSVLFNS